MAAVAGVLVFVLVFYVAAYISSLNADARYPVMPLGEVMLGTFMGIVTGLCSLVFLFIKLQRRDKAKETVYNPQ